MRRSVLKRVPANTRCHQTKRQRSRPPRRGGFSSRLRPAPAKNFRISRTLSARRRIISLGGTTCSPARPSPPLRKVSYSSGGRGPRRAETNQLGWSPVPPGDFGKETARTETRFLEKPPSGPRRRYGPKWPWRAKNPLAPFSSGLHRYHRDLLHDCFLVPCGIFFSSPTPGWERRSVPASSSTFRARSSCNYRGQSGAALTRNRPHLEKNFRTFRFFRKPQREGDPRDTGNPVVLQSGLRSKARVPTQSRGRFSRR